MMNVAPPRGTAGWVAVDEVMVFIEAQLAKHPYIAGKEFSAADILYAGAFALFMNSPLMGDHKTRRLEEYVTRCTSRPAFKRAAGKDEQPRAM